MIYSLRRWAIAFLVCGGLFLFGCRACNHNVDDVVYSESSETGEDKLNMSMYRIICRDASWSDRVEVIVTFGHDSKYSHLIQEIVLEDGRSLVECFRCTTDENVFDKHTWTLRPHARHMKLYVGNVVGADETSIGFAHLPKNKDGSVITAVDAGFNTDYQMSHVTRGAITAVGQDWIEWAITDDGAVVSVRTPDGTWTLEEK